MSGAAASSPDPRQQTPTSDPSRRSTVLQFLLENGFKLMALACLIAAALVFFDAVPEVGREVKVVGLAFFAFLFPAAVVGDRLTNWVPEPVSVWLIDVDARVTDGAIYRFPAEDFGALEVVDGDLEQWGPVLYAGSNVDLEEMTVEGTWRGTLTDRELVASLQKVYECRDLLEEDAQRAFAYENNLWSIVRIAAKDAVASVVETFERGTLPDEGDGLDHAVNDALDQFGLERRYSGDDDALEELDVDLDELGDVLDAADVDADDLDRDAQDDPSGEQTERTGVPQLSADDD